MIVIFSKYEISVLSPRYLHPNHNSSSLECDIITPMSSDDIEHVLNGTTLQPTTSPYKKRLI